MKYTIAYIKTHITGINGDNHFDQRYSQVETNDIDQYIKNESSHPRKDGWKMAFAFAVKG